MLADPIGLNSRLGTYTNFVNLLDLCGLACRRRCAADGTPFGVTLLAPPGTMRCWRLSAATFHAGTGLPLGAVKQPQPPLAPAAAPGPRKSPIAVVGAHLSGMPLNGELRAPGARLLETAATAPDYRLYALSGAARRSPGSLRVAPEGAAPRSRSKSGRDRTVAFGRFVAAIPPPLSIGTLELADGRKVKGLLVEAEGVAGARDISSFGGWRAFWRRRTSRFDRIAGDEMESARLVDKTHVGSDDPPAFGKRTQVCIWRPVLPGTLGRWNSVEATAQSRP